ncbi:MAG: hypothetical protein HZA34_02625 [Candidatus Pacebacteria bacterium]|nr:hypothetical protein [Candidatus Paceibacterota bacterium]
MPKTDPAFGNVEVGVGVGRDVPVVVVGVGDEEQRQFALLKHAAVRQRLFEHTSPAAQSLFVTQPLLHPFGGVGEGVGQRQLDEPVHRGLRHEPACPGDAPEHTRPD